MLAHARAKLDAARVLLGTKAFGDPASRAYYAAFHAVSLCSWPGGKRTAAMRPREFTTILARLFEDRQTGDYDPTTRLEAADAERDVADAERIVDAIDAHLSRAGA